MHASTKRSRRWFGVIGGVVGVATAAVIVLLATTDEPDEPAREPAPTSASPAPKVRSTLPEGPRRAAPAPKPDASAATVEPKPGDVAAAKKQRDADNLQKARTAGILGSTALQQGGAFASLTGTGDFSSGIDDVHIYGGLIGNDIDDAKGFGFGGVKHGPGGGGGTMGTRGYGTLGTGMGGRRPNRPTAAVGQPVVTPVSSQAPGELDKAIVRRYLKRNIQRLQYCYEKQLLAKPSLAGAVKARFVILESGNVSGATAHGVDPEVESCVAGVINGILYPKPRGDASVQVDVSFTFRPS